MAAGIDKGRANAGNFVAHIHLNTSTIERTLPLQCAMSIAAPDGDICVGVGDRVSAAMETNVVLIKPAQ